MLNSTVNVHKILQTFIYCKIYTKGSSLGFYFQAIQNPNDEALQEQAWAAVVPLVGRLKKFYQFSQRLGTYLSAGEIVEQVQVFCEI